LVTLAPITRAFPRRRLTEIFVGGEVLVVIIYGDHTGFLLEPLRYIIKFAVIFGGTDIEHLIHDLSFLSRM
jgi:hypothetical protein